MSLPRYPEYKDSGAPWIGNMPSSWNVLPLLAVARERRESNQGMKEDNLLSLSYGRIVRKDMTSNDGLLPESFETYQIVRPGDVVFRLTDLQNDKRSLRTATVEEVGIITSAYLAVEPIGVESRFLSYLLRAYDLSKVFYSMGGGLRQSMKYADVARLPVLAPPVQEQQAIASFLDRETAKIDALIAEQEKLLVLLAEKRQATISHAVTRGLDPNAPMKDSGIPWLGKVPAHWGTARLGDVLDALGDVDHFMPASVEQGVPYLMTGDLKEFISDVEVEGCKQVSHEDYLALSRRIKSSKGDVVMARYATIGTAMYVDTDMDFLVSYACVTLKANPFRVSGLYLFQYLRSDAFRQGLESQVNTNTQGNVGINSLKTISVVLPPLGEQAGITEYVGFETARIDKVRAEAERAIALLRERRSALVAAAVTGQIDVRGAVESQAA